MAKPMIFIKVNCKYYIYKIPLLIILFNSLLFSQTIPQHRTINWSAAGNSFDFSIPAPIADVTAFGAFGDGIADDYSAIQNAIASFNGNRGIVFFPTGTYLINSPLNLPDSISLKGEGADLTVLKFNTGENNDAIRIQGAISGTFYGLIGGFYKYSTLLTLADSGIFQKGDMAELIQDGTQHMTSSWAMESLGQMLMVDSVSGSQIFLASPLNMDYDMSLNPRIRRITPRKACSVECLKIERLDATTSQTANIGFSFAYNCQVSGVESYFCNFAHIDIRKSFHITVKNSFFNSGHSYGNGGKAYGVCLHATTTACLIENNIFKQLRHAMLLQSGANGNVFSHNYSRDPFWTDVSLPSNSAGDMVLHGNYPYLNLFEGNIGQHIVIDDSHGKNGHHNTFFRNRAELYGIFMNNLPATDSTNFVGNEVTNTGFLLGNYVLNGQNHFEYGNNHKGTIKPPGTASLPDTSYFYIHLPVFMQFVPAFPAIGPPNPLGAYSIPAKDRYLSGINLAYCNDSVFTGKPNTTVIENISFEIVKCYYDDLRNKFEITVKCKDPNSPVHIEVFNLTGISIASINFLPIYGENKVYLPLNSSAYKTGVYIVKAMQGELVRTVKMIAAQ